MQNMYRWASAQPKISIQISIIIMIPLFLVFIKYSNNNEFLPYLTDNDVQVGVQ